MSAQIIPFDKDREPNVPASVERAWSEYDAEARALQALMTNPDSTSIQRRAASIRAIRLHKAFVRAVEANW